ncbi:MAG TPA: AAA family ATPase [Methylomirabilota bacterium]|nr:AAA family ATPase [Methylomirabilota bacterium]
MIWKNFPDIYTKAKTMQMQVSEVKESLQLKDAVAVEQGSRDDDMLALANSLLSRKYNELEVWETITKVNRTYKPPLDDSSMLRIFRQATNFISSKKTSATNENTYLGNREVSQETKLENIPATNNGNKTVSQSKHDDMPQPKLLSELSSERLSVSWIWEGFLARGHKTLISALFKAGKSTWIGLLLKAIEHGTEFLGLRTIPCNILIFTEESEYQWVTRRDELNLQSQIYILSNPLKSKLSYMDWVHWLEWVKKFCKEKEIGLVIIDTISEFWSVNDENKAPEVTQVLMPLNYLTEDDIAVLLVHHFRKSGGTQGTAARGSGALASKVDILVDFTRYEDSEETTKRRLSCLSRFEETPRELVIDYINGDYIVLGNSAEVREKEKLAELLATFEAYPNGFTVKEVWENWDTFIQGKKPSKRTIQRYIARLIDAKQIEKVEDKEINGKLVPFYSVINLRQGDKKIVKTACRKRMKP